mgnify:CR=1
MAKILLWIFVASNLIISFVSDDYEYDISYFSMWAAISIIAICEAIESRVKVKTKQEEK